MANNTDNLPASVVRDIEELPNDMVIVALDAENVMRLRAVSIKPNGNMVVVGGNNAQGKTALLTSIYYALGGKKVQCKEPIRRGAEVMRTRVALGRDNTEELIVSLEENKDGKRQITLMGANGHVYSSPQKILDATTGSLMFDPLAFANADPKTQVNMAREVTGLDFTELDRQREDAFTERTVVNRTLKSLEAKVRGRTVRDDLPERPVETGSILVQMREASGKNRAREQLQRDETNLVQHIDDCKKQIAALQQQLEASDKQLVNIRGKLAETTTVDITEYERKLADIGNTNDLITANNSLREDYSELAAVKANADRLTEMLKKIDQDKAAQIAAAPFPVPGMAFDENGVTLNGLPLDQASSAEQLKLSVGMGFAMNPKVKILLIRDGSLLDEASLALVAKLAKENRGQLWVERVGHGKECSIIIEDGTVLEAE